MAVPNWQSLYPGELGVTREIDRRNGEPIYIPIYGDINSERLPPYHRLDVKISKAFRFNSWEMSLFLELLNAYNRRNLLTYSYSDDYDDDEREVIYYDGDENRRNLPISDHPLPRNYHRVLTVTLRGIKT